MAVSGRAAASVKDRLAGLRPAIRSSSWRMATIATPSPRPRPTAGYGRRSPVATDEAPRNALGIIGASLADPLHRALGWAAYGIPAVLGVWGLRLVLHAGETRVVSRTVASPLALLAVSAFAATHVPPAGWSFDYGLGGLLGDAVLGFGLSLLPFALGPSLLLASLMLAALAFCARCAAGRAFVGRTRCPGGAPKLDTPDRTTMTGFVTARLRAMRENLRGLPIDSR